MRYPLSITFMSTALMLLVQAQGSFLELDIIRNHADTSLTHDTILNLDHSYDSIEFPLQIQLLTTRHLAQLSIGTPPQTFQFLIDTSLHEIGIYQNSCFDQSCEKNGFEPNNSSTFINETTQQGGDIVSDTISIDNSGTFTLSNFSFVLLKPTQNQAKFGFLGLSPNAIKSIDSLVGQLFQSKQILLNGFSMVLGNQSENSKLWIGTYPTPSKGQLDIDWLDTVEGGNYGWTLQLGNISIGPQKVENQTSHLVIIKSGQIGVLIPVTIYEQLISKVQADHVCQYKQKVLYCTCSGLDDNTYPTFSFTLGESDKVYTLEPTSYLAKFSWDEQCYIQQIGVKMTILDKPVWFLGELFLKKYYQIYDMQGSPRIGLADPQFIFDGDYTFGNSSIYRQNTQQEIIIGGSTDNSDQQGMFIQ